MSEKELDLNLNKYVPIKTHKNYIKQLQWDMAIGLQKVDNLKPSNYLKNLIKKNVSGTLTLE